MVKNPFENPFVTYFSSKIPLKIQLLPNNGDKIPLKIPSFRNLTFVQVYKLVLKSETTYDNPPPPLFHHVTFHFDTGLP